MLFLKSPVVPKKNSVTIDARGVRPRYIKNQRAVESEHSIMWEAHKQAREQNWAVVPRPQQVAIRVGLKKTRADLIGLLETIFDALQKVVYENDAQIATIEAQWLLPETTEASDITAHIQVRTL